MRCVACGVPAARPALAVGAALERGELVHALRDALARDAQRLVRVRGRGRGRGRVEARLPKAHLARVSSIPSCLGSAKALARGTLSLRVVWRTAALDDETLVGVRALAPVERGLTWLEVQGEGEG